MNLLSNFPYFEVQFNKEGKIHDQGAVRQVMDYLRSNETSDLVVISHGWNNDIKEAQDLYKRFFAEVRKEIDSGVFPALASRDFAILGILWPSKKFADEDLIPSGAADFGLTSNEDDELQQQLEALKGVFDLPEADARLDQAKLLVNSMEDEEEAAAELVDLIRSLPHKQEIHPDDNSDEFFQMSGYELLDKLSRPDLPLPMEEDLGGAAGFEAGITFQNEGEAAGFDPIGGIKSAVRKVLNFTTYYQMKERSGVVGRTGAYQVLAQIREAKPTLKIHLVGHSFGGRLVTALALGPAQGRPISPASMTLLQAAFSHNGFAENFDGTRDGFFRKVVSEQKVKGPILITHSVKDTAVGIAYPIASKLSGDDAATFGDAESLFGGIGRNGAQHTPEAENNIPLSPVTYTYRFHSGKLYNLRADTLIMGHSDVTKAEIAHAFLSAIASV